MVEWLKTGLREEDASKRLLVYGRNVIGRKRKLEWLKRLLSQFKSPLIYVLLLAVAATAYMGDVNDALVIGAAVFINTILGFVMENRAAKSLEALTGILDPKVEVYRDGKRRLMAAAELVPGDIVFISNEHRIGADGILIEEDGVFCEEAVLTGESMDVEKLDYVGEIKWEEVEREFEKIDSKYKVFAGTVVRVGVGRALVVRTGAKTRIGQIAASVGEVDEGSPLQEKVGRLARQLAGIFGILAVAVMGLGLIMGRGWMEVWPIGVALAVAAIPEGLAISLTVILAVGMRRMLNKGALLRKLMAAETLGSVDVVCADKTGTLTEGTMQVTQADGDEVLLRAAAALCNDRRDPLEIAMAEWATGHGEKTEVARWESLKRVDSRPFDNKKKYIATLNGVGKQRVFFVSGAPEVVMGMCRLTKAEEDKWKKKMDGFAERGLRLVGFANGKPGAGNKIKEQWLGQLKWLGLVVFEDPVRPSVEAAIKKIQSLGISVKVITGDYVKTALAVVQQVGLSVSEEQIMTGEEMMKLDDKTLRERVERTVLFARTTPEEKLKITSVLKELGHSVAMTGDGVNDAPALHKADIGIVVSSATEVAKETAEMVLIKNDFGTIVEAIEEGRGMFENLRKVVVYLMSDAFAGMGIITVGMLLNWPLPILAVQILWVNLITDGLPSVALAVEPRDEEEIRGKPRSKKEGILTGLMGWMIGVVSVIVAGGTLLIFWIQYFWGGVELKEARTAGFVFLGMASVMYVFSTRSMKRPFWKIDVKSNLYLLLAVVLGILGQIVVVYEPHLQAIFGTTALNVGDWLLVGIGVVVVMAAIESLKLIGLKISGSKERV